MVFLNPWYLWALLGLIVPVAIHLWNKKQGKTIQVGHIKFLKTSDSQRSKSLKFRELVLLLLRMLLISLLVFLLSEPQLRGKTERSPVTYVVEASLLTSPKIKSLTDSLNSIAEVRLLETDFPDYSPEDLESSFIKTPNYWQLAQAMENLATDSLVVFTNAFVRGIKGKRPEIHKKINWIYLNSKEPQTHLVGGVKKGNKVEYISAVSSAELVKFQKEIREFSDENQSQIPILEQDTLQVTLYSEENFKAEEKYLKASFKALEEYLDLPIQLKIHEPEDDLISEDLLIWLSETSAPEVEGKSMTFKKDVFADDLITPGVNPGEFYLTNKLNSENIVSEHLAEQLLAVLNLYPEIVKKSKTYDLRVMNPALMNPKFGGVQSSKKAKKAKSISPYLWLVLILLLVSERVLARYRKQ